jgi:hypothetical protein
MGGGEVLGSGSGAVNRIEEEGAPEAHQTKLSTAARAWPVGRAAVARAGGVARARGRRGRLQVREAAPCHRGALGGDSKIDL